jgi:phosphopantothenoylcysteine decarboxylase / phosphopantothenate---cysteine ligase
MARILITCGPTREPIDPVRYLSNASTGRMGIALAAEALRRGHEVDLVLGPVEVHPPPGARVVPAVTCADMLAACRALHPACRAVIGAAAVCDFRPRELLPAKRTRDSGAWALDLVPNPDILSDLGRSKGSRIHAGFALETGAGAEAVGRAREKLERKNLDWIVLNGPEALGREEAAYILLGRGRPPLDLGRLPKTDLAHRLLEEIENSLKGGPPEADQER